MGCWLLGPGSRAGVTGGRADGAVGRTVGRGARWWLLRGQVRSVREKKAKKDFGKKRKKERAKARD